MTTASGRARKVAMLGVLDAVTRAALVHASPTRRSGASAALLEWLDRAYGPAPGQTRKPDVLVLDNGPIRTSQATTKALAALDRGGVAAPIRARVSPIEGTWRDLSGVRAGLDLTPGSGGFANE